MKKLIYIVILLIPISILGQSDNCDQYERVINYFKTDTTFNSYFNGIKLKFRIKEKVGSGGVYPFMTYEYVAGELGLDDKKSVFSQDTSTLHSMARKIEQEEYSDTTEFLLTCLSEYSVKRNAKIYVNFYRKDNDVLVVYTGRLYKKPRHTYGMIHLFFFDEKDNIRKVFETDWVE